MSDRAKVYGGRLRGHPRPVDPDWQLSQREAWAMLSRHHFTRFAVARIVRRQLVTTGGRVVKVRKTV